MNTGLSHLASSIDLPSPAQEPTRFAFAAACVGRIEHLLEDPRAIEAATILRRYVAGEVDRATLDAAAARVAGVARSHPGSRSLDGGAHAAVSATNAVAHALAGRALQAADYAAYAAVYAYGGYAVSDPAAFEPEFAWQVKQLQSLVRG